jgi:hypothetical protein
MALDILAVSCPRALLFGDVWLALKSQSNSLDGIRHD